MPIDAVTDPAAHAPTLRRIDDLPGPPGLPLLGNLLQIEKASMHLKVEQWSREYGPLFHFRLAKRHFLVVADHEAVGSMLRDRPDGFRRTERLDELWREMGFQPGLFGANGDAWRRQRRMVMAGFDPGHVKAYFPSLQKVALRLRGRWQKAARAEASIDLQADLMRYTVDAITGLAFGADVNTLESDDEVIQHHLDPIFPALFRRAMAPVAYWRVLRLPADRRLDRSVKHVVAAIEGFIAQARERMHADPSLREHPGNLLEAMIAAVDSEGSGVDDRDVAGNVLTMLLAGEDTTANTLAWMIHLLHSNPEALARARDEVRRIAPDAAAFTPGQMNALDYVEACAHETMRLRPVAPILVLQAERDTVLADVRVPKGTIVWSVMRHDSVGAAYFADPLAFDPGRWLADGNPRPAAGSAKRVSMPFGAGPRVCPGRYLALLEMKMAMAMLLGSFDIQSVGTADGSAVRERLAFAMAPVGLRMRLRERN